MTLFGAEIGFVDQNIDSGKFDVDPAGNFSISQRNIFRLDLAAYVYKRFSRNCGSTSRDELVKYSGATPVETETELEFLVASGVLLRTDEGAAENAYYTPARNVATFTAADCLEMMENCGLSRQNPHPLPVIVVKSFAIARKKEAADTLLSKLA